MVQFPRSSEPVDRRSCPKHRMRKSLSLESPPIPLFLIISGCGDQENILIEIMPDRHNVTCNWLRSLDSSWVWKFFQVASEQNARAWPQWEYVGSRKIQNCWECLEKCYVSDHCVLDTDELLGVLFMCFEHPVFGNKAATATAMIMNEI